MSFEFFHCFFRWLASSRLVNLPPRPFLCMQCFERRHPLLSGMRASFHMFFHSKTGPNVGYHVLWVKVWLPKLVAAYFVWSGSWLLFATLMTLLNDDDRGQSNGLPDMTNGNSCYRPSPGLALLQELMFCCMCNVPNLRRSSKQRCFQTLWTWHFHCSWLAH